MNDRWTSDERAAIEHRSQYVAVGSPETVRARLQGFRNETVADEIIATSQIYDHAARLRSFEIAANVFQKL
jgi:alkanesulfonate monooxygenase SsuD/methylene tetrahydromethanopterin reductase-like flavin-dependent oxidoreductase (luciferase family)